MCGNFWCQLLYWSGSTCFFIFNLKRKKHKHGSEIGLKKLKINSSQTLKTSEKFIYLHKLNMIFAACLLLFANFSNFLLLVFHHFWTISATFQTFHKIFSLLFSHFHKMLLLFDQFYLLKLTSIVVLKCFTKLHRSWKKDFWPFLDNFCFFLTFPCFILFLCQFEPLFIPCFLPLMDHLCNFSTIFQVSF